MTRSEAYAYRAKIERAAAKLTDSEALTSAELFERWSGRAYTAGERVTEVAANTAARHKHINKAVLAKLAEDDKGRLTYGGKAIVNEVIDSLTKWDGGGY